MKKRVVIPVAFVMIPLVIAAISLLRPIPVKGEGGKNQGTEVRVDNFTFTPETITVPVNSTVTWVNKDDVPHVIASNNGLFKSKALDTDQSYSYTFIKPGKYEYYCSVHPKMVGTVIVR